MKILITGGSGFIGSKISERLLARGDEVSVLDLNKPSVKGVSYFQGSVSKLEDIEKAMSGCDSVFHLAAMIGVKTTEENPLKTLDVNIQGTRNILDACRKKDVKKILLTSSSEYYGEPVKTPLSENDLPRPKSAYGISKVVCESYVKAFNAEYGLNYSIVRYFNVYGPGQSTAFVLPKFVDLALKGEPITIYGDGKQVRCFAHINDVAEGTILAFSRKEGVNNVFNIGNSNEPITMKDLAYRVLKQSGSKAKPVFVPLEKTDRSAEREVYNRIPNVSKAGKMLGYKPKVTLDEGIKTLINYFKGKR